MRLRMNRHHSDNPKPPIPSIQFVEDQHGVTARCGDLGIFGHGTSREAATNALKLAFGIKFPSEVPPWER